MENSLTSLIKLFSANPLLCEHDNCLISSLRALRNGLYYGGKIRFVHSIVMEILFGKNESIFKRIINIIKPTLEHALNLGMFAFIYKSIVCLLKNMFKSDHKIFSFLAGMVGAFFMWRAKSNVNMQIVLYLLSRNLLALSNLIKDKYFPQFEFGFPLSSLLVWGVVMFLFESNPNALQTSLKHSMDFIYKESDKCVGWRDLIPFYIPNGESN